MHPTVQHEYLDGTRGRQWEEKFAEYRRQGETETPPSVFGLLEDQAAWAQTSGELLLEELADQPEGLGVRPLDIVDAVEVDRDSSDD